MTLNTRTTYAQERVRLAIHIIQIICGGYLFFIATRIYNMILLRE